jgi:mono/diheme cytochrome c family protein
MIAGAAATMGILALNACQQAGKNATGSEFIPDMAHSIAYEANVLTNYSLNTWDKESTVSRRELSVPRLPVNGTIPRGYAAVSAHDGVFASAEAAVLYTRERTNIGEGISYTPNGSTPYYYPDSEEGRTAATEQVLYNPFPITAEGLAKGKELYDVFCGICHGEKADGAGYLVRDDGGKYPAQPANLVDQQFLDATNGRFYHAVIYGKNAMGGYADKLSYEERWQVIHYIRSLQAKSLKLQYDEQGNTFQSAYGVPAALLPQPDVTPEEPDHAEEHVGAESH